MILLVHGGQTGVDRGGHDGALANGWQIWGYMPADGCDELGLVPDDVAKYLDRCRQIGYPARTKANLLIADLLLVMVEDKQQPYATPGTRLTLTAAGKRKPYLERKVVDPSDGVDEIATWIADYRAGNQDWKVHLKKHVWLMVAGPRASKWRGGEAAMRDYLIKLKPALEARR